jgi:hypothetical protein
VRSDSLQFRDGRPGEESRKAFDRLNGPVEEFQEGVPLFRVENEDILIRQRLLCGECGVLQDECTRAEPDRLRGPIEQLSSLAFEPQLQPICLS